MRFNLARLAVASLNQKQRLGEKLLIDAIYRTVLVAEQISAIGLYVDPTTPEVIPFYQPYGFLTAEPGNDFHIEMWLPIRTFIQVVSSLL
jgi:ribosomal protein S18 acetylase RimI-like enzyme